MTFSANFETDQNHGFHVFLANMCCLDLYFLMVLEMRSLMPLMLLLRFGGSHSETASSIFCPELESCQSQLCVIQFNSVRLSGIAKESNFSVREPVNQLSFGSNVLEGNEMEGPVSFGKF